MLNKGSHIISSKNVNLTQLCINTNNSYSFMGSYNFFKTFLSSAYKNWLFVHFDIIFCLKIQKFFTEDLSWH